jgi:hypothetical protein
VKVSQITNARNGFPTLAIGLWQIPELRWWKRIDLEDNLPHSHANPDAPRLIS